ncbi:GNAT family N-acetyltransferase [Chelativorans salis]|uniref:GNAT family N-acetyltransferase n=1 Tax=Chelativorans salis TaxID=2978478 RepID=A0ABT2LW11_9HYPH|nr:GNAT family N-acetyltransferase [Chelativorans sp. EGI FJ00035]MCT7378299.1 GNAT family N-acetyltransferase [Chelativorans sp. EGI FJ00035]
MGMFGLEQHETGGMELRRMYVAPHARRLGVARQMLAFAENLCRSRAISALHLSTSELQVAALSFYRKSGYRLDGEEIADTASNKTVGSGIRRFHFVKVLS